MLVVLGGGDESGDSIEDFSVTKIPEHVATANYNSLASDSPVRISNGKGSKATVVSDTAFSVSNPVLGHYHRAILQAWSHENLNSNPTALNVEVNFGMVGQTALVVK